MEHLGLRKVIYDDFSWSSINWVQGHNHRINKAKLLKDKDRYICWLSSLEGSEIQWVLEWVPCQTPSLQSANFPFIPLLGNEGIVPYMPFRVLRQFGRVQTVPPALSTERFNILFERGIRPEPIPERSNILSAWGSRRSCHELSYDPKQRAIPRTTPQYDTWLKCMLGRQQRNVMDPAEEIARLTRLLEAKDKELVEKETFLKEYKKDHEKLQE